MEYPLFEPLDRMQQKAHAPMNRVFAGKPITAQEAKSEAIARVDRHTPREWKVAFRRAIEKVARQRLRFNADSVWEEFQKDYCDWEGAHPRAAGAVILQARRDGIIVLIRNMFWNSKRRSCHGRPIQVYQSTLFR